MANFVSVSVSSAIGDDCGDYDYDCDDGDPSCRESSNFYTQNGKRETGKKYLQFRIGQRQEKFVQPLGHGWYGLPLMSTAHVGVARSSRCAGRVVAK
jgi:hypothetical protein